VVSALAGSGGETPRCLRRSSRRYGVTTVHWRTLGSVRSLRQRLLDEDEHLPCNPKKTKKWLCQVRGAITGRTPPASVAVLLAADASVWQPDTAALQQAWHSCCLQADLQQHHAQHQRRNQPLVNSRPVILKQSACGQQAMAASLWCHATFQSPPALLINQLVAEFAFFFGLQGRCPSSSSRRRQHAVETALFRRPVAVDVSVKPIHSGFIVVRHDTSRLLIKKLSLGAPRTLSSWLGHTMATTTWALYEDSTTLVRPCSC